MTDQLVRPTADTTDTTDRPTGDRHAALMARIGELDPLLREEAGAGEAGGRLTPRVAEALHASGVYTRACPASSTAWSSRRARSSRRSRPSRAPTRPRAGSS
ncbi:hypothetical protein PHK61_23520 [Actinomycetospora lutea]|uniref:hypothetical protein n=1 Tax=Actinomycetospora lutea TaxID=663604 RepID=UPI002365967A|nr:hypothetical protein [Actinomycetospora lutea]MDD7941395.1 hypothetical protein [Actinomycetospora lutea]